MLPRHFCIIPCENGSFQMDHVVIQNFLSIQNPTSAFGLSLKTEPRSRSQSRLGLVSDEPETGT